MNRAGCCTLLLLALGACRADSPPGTTVTDSAGVRLTVSVDAPVAFAALDSVPTLSIGGPDATGPAQFFRVQNVLVDRAGRIWVADGQSGEVRIFLADGTHWKTRGGRGAGDFVRTDRLPVRRARRAPSLRCLPRRIHPRPAPPDRRRRVPRTRPDPA